MRYVQGKDRHQTTLFPAVVDDYVTDDNPIRFIDYFVDNHINFAELDFTYNEPKITGRLPYNPADMLKLYIYGYLNRIRSSRRLEAETHRNLELMWLIRGLHPDFKTIADFRKNNKKAIREVCRTFTLLCRDLGLFGLEFFGIDGSKFAAVAHTSKAFTKEKLKELIRDIDQQVDNFLETIEQQDVNEQDVTKPTAEQLQKKIDALKESRQVYETYQEILEESGETQIVITEPDSRLMRTGHNGRDVCYNVQIAVDKKHKLAENPQYMYYRRILAEHPFGTLKQAFGFTYFLCRGLDMVKTEMSLSVLAYNMRRVINILGVKELIAA